MTKKLLNRLFSVIFFALFILSTTILKNLISENYSYIREIISILLISISICFLFPDKLLNKSKDSLIDNANPSTLSKKTWIILLLMIIAIPITLLSGFFFFKDKKYYLISLLVIFETFLPFILRFENKKTSSREIVLISALSALTICGRTAFAMLPQFKPTGAIIIITGICFGEETGFLVGAVSSFVSNFFFGQGPWTPWQMFSYGLLGLLAGILFNRGIIKCSRISIAIYGALSTLFIYSLIMNIAHVILWQPEFSLEMIISSIVLGFPYDMVHVFSTVFFIWLGANPLIETLERIKTKYGI